MGPEAIQFRPRTRPTPPSGALTRLGIEGMDCGNCVRSVTEALQGVAGISRAVVDLRAATARAYWLPDRPAEPERLIAAVRKAGYRARLLEDAGSAAHPAPSASPAAPHPWKTALWLGIPATILLLAGDWLADWSMHRPFQWVAWAVATVVQAGVGWRFYRGAWRQAQAGRSNMDTLVSLGSSTAYLWSLWLLFTQAHAHLFFTESVSILTLISVGHALEARMSAKAGDALKALLALAPATARRLDAGGQEQEIPVAQLRTGDRLRIKPGDRIPVDAVVLEGASSADESLLTGEPMPVGKTPGSALLAGSVNVEGSLVVRVNATGEHTTLARIAAVVERAQSSRASVQRLADQVSSVFVPVVVVIACLAAAAWAWNPAMIRHWQAMLAPLLWHPQASTSPMSDAVAAFCSVLIVACPCAMGLATPVALMAGINAAARRGILIRDAIALEKAGRISALAFDKTGTLTVGRPSVTRWDDLRPAESRSVPLLTLAHTLAERSQHPVSRAVVATARALRDPGPGTATAVGSVSAVSPAVPSLMSWRELRGQGIEAIAAGSDATRPLRLGSLGWMRSLGVPLDRESEAAIQQASDAGQSVLLLVEGTVLLGILQVGDAVRPDSADVLQRLHDQGIETWLLSGDTGPACQAVAKAVGIPPERVRAECRPEDKVRILGDIRARGRRVAFVGDGINDSPALAAADLGIAVALASDVAREAADIVLLRPDLAAVVEALDLAGRTLRTIRQNLFWAFFYNAAAVPLAALGFLSPVVCALTMGLSDLIVIGNALRLRHTANARHRDTRPS
ncbi:MAG: Cation transport ATPase [Verrucomicrobiota bacterium]|jgi:Cu+-exporting ATPase